MKLRIFYTALAIIHAFCLDCVAQNEFYFNGGADVIFRYPPRGSGGRAFVHDDSNILTLNFQGDFSGGTKIGNALHVANDGTLSIPDGKLLNTSLISTNGYSTMTLVSRAWETAQGPNGKAFSFITHTDAGGGGFEALAIHYGQSGKIVMAHNGGNVGIGTASPTEKLSVNGNIRAKEIKVENANWPDYVFDQGYKLPSLLETEKHIKEKGHLPGIPSAAEVAVNGIELGEINKKLLEKIEELTLHLIEMKKENTDTKQELLKQREEMRLLKSLIKRK